MKIDIECYKRLRQSEVYACFAFNYAKIEYNLAHEILIPEEFKGIEIETGTAVLIERDGFYIRFCRSADERCDFELLGLGHFTDRKIKGAISHEPNNPRTFNWFIPNISEQEYFEDYQRQGFSKQVARIKARESVNELYRLACTYGETWWNDHISITVFLGNDIILCETFLDGVRDDAPTKDFLLDLIEKTDEAIEEAKQTLRYICNYHKSH